MAYVVEQDTYRIQLPIFEGPFDLLLFFIERDELDVHDIPIARITRDFLDYITHLERMNIEVASEFILVASTLMRIKAKMLIVYDFEWSKDQAIFFNTTLGSELLSLEV